jgi:hypothetical protein
LDPFIILIDTTVNPKIGQNRTGNRLHLKTKTSYKKPIAFQKKPYTDLSIKESERIIRQQNLLTALQFALPEEKSDSVDVYIRVLDSWSSIPKFHYQLLKIHWA